MHFDQCSALSQDNLYSPRLCQRLARQLDKLTHTRCLASGSGDFIPLVEGVDPAAPSAVDNLNAQSLSKLP
jgi:hypothetical protein